MKNFLLGVFACVAIVALLGANVQRVAPKHMTKFIQAGSALRFQDTIKEQEAEGWELSDFEPIDRNGSAFLIWMVFKKE